MGPGAVHHRGDRPEAPESDMAPGGEERDAACTAAEPCDAMAAASRLRPGQLFLSGSLGKLCDITVLRSLRRRQMRMRGGYPQKLWSKVGTDPGREAK